MLFSTSIALMVLQVLLSLIVILFMTQSPRKRLCFCVIQKTPPTSGPAGKLQLFKNVQKPFRNEDAKKVFLQS